MEIGERLLVVPEWEQAQEDGRVKLVLNPGLTFGTGSHATTRLCLQALEQHIHGLPRFLGDLALLVDAVEDILRAEV